jgi:NhaP-type Na+/H+ or K+/H+ antiporter
MLMMSPGGALMGFVYPFNLREIGNGVALWLGIEPYELFFYIFLPPLLLDAALKIDWYIFKKVSRTRALRSGLMLTKLYC